MRRSGFGLILIILITLVIIIAIISLTKFAIPSKESLDAKNQIMNNAQKTIDTYQQNSKERQTIEVK